MANEGNIFGNFGGIIKNIYTAVVAIAASILTMTETGGTLTTDGNEQNVYINNAPAGIYGPLQVLIDFTAQTGGETLLVKTYYRIKSGGNLIKHTEVSYAGVQDPLLINTVLRKNRYGVKVTAQLTAGANRDYDWEVVYDI